MGVYDTLVLPGTKADGEQVKCWFNQMHNIRVGDEVPPITEAEKRDYVIIMRCDGCLVVRDCKLQGYFLPAEFVPGDPPVQELPMFDKWGDTWLDTWHNNGILGEPYFYRDAAIVRTINSVARAYRYRDFGDDHDERSR